MTRKNSRTIFFLLTVAAGLFILYPHWNFLMHLSPGDHGRDLYSFKKVYEGALPYRDFWTQNGPLMPYYYGVFYRIFGVSIQSTSWGYQFLALLTGIFIFAACCTFLSPGTALLAAVWYWAFRVNEFFYTFNHIGAVFFLTVVILCALRYMKGQKNSSLFWGNLSLAGLTLARPDIGMTSIAAFYISVFLIRRRKDQKDIKTILRDLLPLPLGIIILVLIIYTVVVIKFPVLARSREIDFWNFIFPGEILRNIVGLKDVFLLTFNHCWPGRSFVLFSWLLLVKIYFSRGRKMQDQDPDHVLAVKILLLFIVFSLLEYTMGSRMFRWRWAFVPSLIFVFAFLETGIRLFRSKTVRVILYLYLLALPMGTAVKNLIFIQSCKVPANHLTVNGDDIYLEPYQRENIVTFTRAAAYLRRHVPPGETFLAFPYDPIYYFLSDRDSAFRELNFFHTPPLPTDIERVKINHIIVSNRAVRWMEQPDLIFGKTFAVDFARYLKDNFEEAATLGPWDQPTHWVYHHAIKIFRRRPPAGSLP